MVIDLYEMNYYLFNMTHSELSEEFKIWHEIAYPERRIFSNRTGVAVYGKKAVPYGIPAPLRGRKKKDGGGGPDFLSFGNENGYFTAWCFEVKTLKDRMKSNQNRFADYVLAQGGKYWIVKEQETGGFELIALHEKK